jgi:hypothetical protein
MSELAPGTNPQIIESQIADGRLQGEAGTISFEFLDRPQAVLSFVYNGVRASISEIRAQRAGERQVIAENGIDFYDSLADLSHTVINGPESLDNPSAPTPPVEQGALSNSAASQGRVLAYRQLHRSAGGGAFVAPAVSSPRLPDLHNPIMPMGREQRAAERAAAERLETIRDNRQLQGRRGRVFGRSGVERGLVTRGARLLVGRDARRDYRNGAIDAFELRDIGRRGRELLVTQPARRVQNTHNELQYLEDGTVEHLDRLADRSQIDSDRHRDQAARHMTRAAGFRTRQAAARARI